MARLVGLSGSLRKGSFNTALLVAAAEMMPDGAELSVHTVRGIPLYDADAEASEGIPRTVIDLKEAIAASDGLLLATPEYNNSVSGVMKNAIDWLTRPPSDLKRVFGDKPVALLGASPGGFGTILSQNAWLPIVRYLGMQPWFGGRLLVSSAQSRFDDNGHLTDDELRAQLGQFIQGFVEFARSSSSPV